MGGEKPLRILVIDDDDSIRKSMAAILSLDGYDIQTAQDGQHGLELVKKSSFDIIFMDFNMPGMNGLETFLELKKIAGKATVVVLMTAFASEALKTELLNIGVYAVYTKPFDLDSVLSKIIDGKFSGRKPN